MGLSLDQLKLSLNLHNILRFQTHRLQSPKSVAEHSFRMGMIYAYLGGKELIAAFGHDAEEALTGDLPSPIKKDLQGLEKYEALRPSFEDAIEKKLGKLADKLELILDLQEQLDDTGILPKKLRIIYDDEKELAFEIAKDIGKLKEVKQLLKDLNK
jgi:5'-deoxynucleotidase YfbR-like HD superfamily hydrolase